jgi:hypothetical protein
MNQPEGLTARGAHPAPPFPSEHPPPRMQLKERPGAGVDISPRPSASPGSPPGR